MELNRSNIKKILGIIVFAILFLFAVQHFSKVLEIVGKCIDIFAPVIIGLCVAFILNIPMRAFEKSIFKFIANSKNPKVRAMLRPISLIFTLLVTVGFVVLLILIIVPQLKDAVILLFSKVPYYADRLIDFIEPKLQKYGIEANINSWHPSQLDMAKVQTMLSKVFSIKDRDELISTTMGFTSSVLSGVINFALGAILAIYILAEKEKILKLTSRIIKAILPQKAYNRFDHICTVSETSFSSFITGQFLDSAIRGILCFIGMTIFRFPSAAIISVLTGVTALIPVIGPLIGEAIGFVIIFIESPLKAILFIVFTLVLQTIDNNFIYPKVVGKSTGLPGLIVLVAVIVGGNIGGIMGILLGVPVVSVIYVLVIDALQEKEAKKLIEQNKDSNIHEGE